MKDRVSSKTTSSHLLTPLPIIPLLILLTLTVVACSHSLTKPIHSSHEIITGAATNAITPDFIIPPNSISRTEELSTALANDDQLIWQHIAKNLALSQFYVHPRVARQKQKYLDNAEFLSIVTRRSEPFIYFVLNEIEQRQMPTELAILPIVESGYFPKARSRAKAVGLWQFMPYTAREFGLQRTQGYDGRHDVYASTIAALDYLAQLNNKFDGDWLLTLAAYNAGPQRIKRALQKSTASKDENSYWDLHLPRETREYIPKILALSAIINDNEYSSTLLHPIDDEAHIESIEINKRISPSKLVQASGINATELLLLNPALRNLNNPTPENYHLLVPKQKTELVSTTIDNLPAEKLPLWEQHVIASGESLSVIAIRYDTSVAAIRETNNLHNNTIVAGRTLRIPTSKTSRIQTHRRVAKQAPILPKDDAPYFYVVTNGDSFWKIANRNNTTVDRLAIINDRNPNQPLQAGESILID